MNSGKERIYDYEPLWGRWRIEGALGKDSYGSVYKVSKEEMGYKYTSAVKLITVPTEEQYREAEASIGSDRETLKSYFSDVAKNIVSEINKLYQLRGNGNIVSYEDHMVIPNEDGLCWDILVRMENVDSLPVYMEDRQLSMEQVLRLGMDICSGLAVCSREGILHGNIKERNIFINSKGTFKLGGFDVTGGLSKGAMAASTRGAPVYTAPEVYKGDRYDSTADIYSLGIILYKLLNHGRMPFLPPYPGEIKYSDNEIALGKRMIGEPLPVPAKAKGILEDIILKACSFNPSDRYRNPADMKTDLELALEDMSPSERNEPVTIARNKVAEALPDSAEAAPPHAKNDIIIPLQRIEDTSEGIMTIDIPAVPEGISSERNAAEAVEENAGQNPDKAARHNRMIFALIGIAACVLITFTITSAVYVGNMGDKENKAALGAGTADKGYFHKVANAPANSPAAEDNTAAASEKTQAPVKPHPPVKPAVKQNITDKNKKDADKNKKTDKTDNADKQEQKPKPELKHVIRLSAARSTENSLSLRWDPSDKKHISFVYNATNKKRYQVGSGINTYTITGLKPDTNYEIYIITGEGYKSNVIRARTLRLKVPAIVKPKMPVKEKTPEVVLPQAIRNCGFAYKNVRLYSRGDIVICSDRYSDSNFYLFVCTYSSNKSEGGGYYSPKSKNSCWKKIFRFKGSHRYVSAVSDGHLVDTIYTVYSDNRIYKLKDDMEVIGSQSVVDNRLNPECWEVQPQYDAIFTNSGVMNLLRL